MEQALAKVSDDIIAGSLAFLDRGTPKQWVPFSIIRVGMRESQRIDGVLGEVIAMGEEVNETEGIDLDLVFTYLNRVASLDRLVNMFGEQWRGLRARWEERKQLIKKPDGGFEIGVYLGEDEGEALPEGFELLEYDDVVRETLGERGSRLASLIELTRQA